MSQPQVTLSPPNRLLLQRKRIPGNKTSQMASYRNPPRGRAGPIRNRFCLAFFALFWSFPPVTSAAKSVVLFVRPTEVRLGNEVTFECSAPIGSTTQIIWFFNGKPMISGPGKAQTPFARVLSNASIADAGNYQCQAVNGSSLLSSQHETLSVYTIPAISRRPNNETVRVGQDVTLLVGISNFYGSALPMEVYWSRSNALLLEEKVHGTENGMVNVTHVLWNVSEQDSAIYSLHLSSHSWNSMEVPDVYFSLTVKPLVPPGNVTVYNVTNSSFALSWEYPQNSGPPTTSVFFYSLLSEGQTDKSVDAKPGVSSLLLTDLVCGTYHVYGKAEGTNGHQSKPSPTFSVSTLTTPLNPSTIFVNTSGQVMVIFKESTLPLCSVDKIMADQHGSLCQILSSLRIRHVVEISERKVFEANLNQTASSLATLFASCLTEGLCADGQLLNSQELCRTTTNTPSSMSETPTSPGIATPKAVSSGLSGGGIAAVLLSVVVVVVILLTVYLKRKKLKCKKGPSYSPTSQNVSESGNLPGNNPSGEMDEVIDESGLRRDVQDHDSALSGSSKKFFRRKLSSMANTPSEENLIAVGEPRFDEESVFQAGPSNGERRPSRESNGVPRRPPYLKSTSFPYTEEDIRNRQTGPPMAYHPTGQSPEINRIFDVVLQLRRQVVELGDRQDDQSSQITKNMEQLRKLCLQAIAGASLSSSSQNLKPSQPATAASVGMAMLPRPSFGESRRGSEDSTFSSASSVKLPTNKIEELNQKIDRLRRQVAEKKQVEKLQADMDEVIAALESIANTVIESMSRNHQSTDL